MVWLTSNSKTRISRTCTYHTDFGRSGSYCVGISRGGGTKMREGWSLACWDKRGWPPRIRPSPYVILLRIRSFYVKGCRLKYREPLTLGRTWGHNPWNHGVPDPSQTRHSGHSPTWVTMPNSFAIGQRVRVYVWRSAGKTAPSRLSRLTRVSGTDTNRLGACMTYC